LFLCFYEDPELSCFYLDNLSADQKWKELYIGTQIHFSPPLSLLHPSSLMPNVPSNQAEHRPFSPSIQKKDLGSNKYESESEWDENEKIQFPRLPRPHPPKQGRSNNAGGETSESPNRTPVVVSAAQFGWRVSSLKCPFLLLPSHSIHAHRQKRAQNWRG
jgi:hypothetical protein